MATTNVPEEDLLGLQPVQPKVEPWQPEEEPTADEPIAVEVVELGKALARAPRRNDSAADSDGAASARRRKQSPVTRILRRASVAGRPEGRRRRRRGRAGDRLYKGRQTATSQVAPLAQPPARSTAHPPQRDRSEAAAPRQPPPQGAWAELGATVRRKSRDEVQRMRHRISVTSHTVLRRLSNVPPVDDAERQALRERKGPGAAATGGTPGGAASAPRPAGDGRGDEPQRCRDEAWARREAAAGGGGRETERTPAAPAKPAAGDESDREDDAGASLGSFGSDDDAAVESPRRPSRGSAGRLLRSSSLDTSMKALAEEDRSERDGRAQRRSSLDAEACGRAMPPREKRKAMFSKTAMERRRSRRRSCSEELLPDAQERALERASLRRGSVSEAQLGGVRRAAPERSGSLRRSMSEEPLDYKQRMALYSKPMKTSRETPAHGDGERQPYVRQRSSSEGRPEKTGARPERKTYPSRGAQKEARSPSREPRTRKSLNDLRDDYGRGKSGAGKSLHEHLDEGKRGKHGWSGRRNARKSRSGDDVTDVAVVTDVVSGESCASSKNSRSQRSDASSRKSGSRRSDRSKTKKKRYRVSGFVMALSCLCYVISIMLFTAFGVWLHMMFVVLHNSVVPSSDVAGAVEDPGQNPGLKSDDDAAGGSDNASPAQESKDKALSEPSLQPSYNSDGKTDATDDTSLATKHTSSTVASTSSNSPTRTTAPSVLLPGASPTVTTAPSFLPSSRSSTVPSPSPTAQSSALPSASRAPSFSPSAVPSSSPTTTPGCPDRLPDSVVLDAAGTLTLRYAIVVSHGAAPEGPGGLLCISLEYTGGVAGWLGLAFSRASRLPKFGRREAVIGLPGIGTSLALRVDGAAGLGQQSGAGLEDGPGFANPGKYVIPAGGQKGYYGPSLQWSRETDEQTLMNGSVSTTNAYLDPDKAVLDMMMTKLSFSKYLREPGEIAIDPYGSTLLLFAVAAVSPDGDGKDEGNPEWQSTTLQFLESSSETVRPGLPRKRKRQHV